MKERSTKGKIALVKEFLKGTKVVSDLVSTQYFLSLI
jgi:hypothetical protein